MPNLDNGIQAIGFLRLADNSINENLNYDDVKTKIKIKLINFLKIGKGNLLFII